jgi:hypothetical protein
MAKKTKATSVSLTNQILTWARARAAEVARGNFSAYIEGLIQRDRTGAKAKRKEAA